MRRRMMESKKTAEERWKKLNIRSKKWHQFVAEPLFRNVRLMLILVIVIELINGYRTVNLGDMILTVSKLVRFPLSGLAWGTIMVGITCGNLKRFIK
jgi:hypothetical protein